MGHADDDLLRHRERLLVDGTPSTLLTLLGSEPEEPELSHEDAMMHIVTLIAREDYLPIVKIRINYAQEFGDTWRRTGKRKGRKGR